MSGGFALAWEAGHGVVAWILVADMEKDLENEFHAGLRPSVGTGECIGRVLSGREDEDGARRGVAILSRVELAA